MDILEQLTLAGIVPVIKVEDAADAVPLCRALARGGLPVAEITFRSDAAEQAMRNVHEALPDVLLGAGTVLTVEQVDRALDAGATYIVTPGFNARVVRRCIDRGVPIVPGCSCPTDIEAALEMGVKTVKFFPAEALGGVSIIKAISAPYGQVTFMPSGGVNEKNLLDYMAFPKVLACGGSWMAPADAVAARDWERVERLTHTAVDLLLGLRVQRVSAEGGAGWLAGLLGVPANEEPGVTVACHSVERARWHLERRGYAFDEASLATEKGAARRIAFRDRVSGLTVWLTRG